MKYKEIVLNQLLDKYEKSKAYLQKSNRRIMLKAYNIKEYNIENYDEKMLFHNEIKQLKNKEIIDFSWIKFEEENILDTIWLIKENVNKAYQEINRKSPKKETQKIIEELEMQHFQKEWIMDFTNAMKAYMINFQKENSLLPKDKSMDILKALKEIENMQTSRELVTISKRVFSIKCYRDSKFFEKNIEKSLIKIIKQYYIKDNLEKMTDTDALNEVRNYKISRGN